MIERVKLFRDAEAGAVSIDWVVLTAALVGLSFGVVAVLANSTGNVGEIVSNDLISMSMGTGISF